MTRRFALIAALGAAACTVDTAVSDDAMISCETVKDCPPGFLCGPDGMCAKTIEQTNLPPSATASSVDRTVGFLRVPFQVSDPESMDSGSSRCMRRCPE